MFCVYLNDKKKEKKKLDILLQLVMVTLCVTCFDIQRLCNLLTHCIYVIF
jgi:hypothetical protein